MKLNFLALTILAFAEILVANAATPASQAPAERPERATAKEAEAMVKRGVALIKAGRDAAFAEISKPTGSFVAARAALDEA